MFYYLLTLDKCKTKDLQFPTIINYRGVLAIIHMKCGARLANPWLPVECFEYKKKKINKEEYRWLHYHCIFESDTMINYNQVKYDNYSINFKRIRTNEEMIKACGYINKEKIDKSRFLMMDDQ